MSDLERALASLAQFLEKWQVPYMVIGGIANLVWGEPRATLAVDASVLVEETAWPELIAALRRAFRVVPKDPLAFVRDTHVLPLDTDEGVRIDLLWARLPYERRAIARATVEEVASREIAGHRVAGIYEHCTAR
jgi:hypothetical protein